MLLIVTQVLEFVRFKVDSVGLANAVVVLVDTFSLPASAKAPSSDFLLLVAITSLGTGFSALFSTVFGVLIASFIVSQSDNVTLSLGKQVKAARDSVIGV